MLRVTNRGKLDCRWLTRCVNNMSTPFDFIQGLLYYKKCALNIWFILNGLTCRYIFKKKKLTFQMKTVIEWNIDKICSHSFNWNQISSGWNLTHSMRMEMVLVMSAKHISAMWMWQKHTKDWSRKMNYSSVKSYVLCVASKSK